MEEVVPNAVSKHPEGAASTGQEALPPPVIILLWLVFINTHYKGGHFTSAHNWLCVAMMVTSLTVIITIVDTVLRKPKT